MRPYSSKTIEHLKGYLAPGQVYRRKDLASFTSSVDRHLAQLVEEGCLKKLSQGLYMAPKSTSFGEAPPDVSSLLKAFLKDDHFVVYSLGQFNTLGLGTTQLYNQLIVFNRKRVGEYSFGGQTYTFHRWREAPKELSIEFLVVELINRLDLLAEDRLQVLKRLKERFCELNLNRRKLLYAASHYGTISTQKNVEELMKELKDLGHTPHTVEVKE